MRRSAANRNRGGLIAGTLLALLTAGPARAAESTLSLQGGWWSVEAEWKTRWGVYAALGVPWITLLWQAPRQAAPFAARLGYQLELSPSWKLRGAAHLAGHNIRTDCLCGERETQTFGLLELGLRYEGPSGFVAGLDVPLFAFDQAHDLVRGRTRGIELFPFPVSLAFSQIYGGYAWRF